MRLKVLRRVVAFVVCCQVLLAVNSSIRSVNFVFILAKKHNTTQYSRLFYSFPLHFYLLKGLSGLGKALTTPSNLVLYIVCRDVVRLKGWTLDVFK